MRGQKSVELAVDDLHELLDELRVNAVAGLEAAADDNGIAVLHVVQNVVRLHACADDDGEIAHLFAHGLDVRRGDLLVEVILGDDDSIGIMALGIASQLVDGDIRNAIGLGGVDVSKDHGVGRIVLTDLGKRRGAGFDVAEGTGTVVDIGLKADEVSVDGVGHGPLLHEGLRAIHLLLRVKIKMAEMESC